MFAPFERWELTTVDRLRLAPAGATYDDDDSAQGAGLRVTGVTANLRVADIDAARSFYTDYLGLSVEGFNLGWVARFETPDGRGCVQLVTRDATSPQDSVASVRVGLDVDEAYAEAQRRGYEIVRPLTDESWGVRRFLVRDPDGNVINIVGHVDE
jgi:catechol 2,3-dioxygenase-like lactoylglutathione lyase family enzyme